MQEQSELVLIGVDAGGTFTDFVFIGSAGEVIVRKLPSTPSDPGEAIFRGLLNEGSSAGITANAAIVHGTTVATNALLERKGAKTVLIMTAGFKDVLEIGRQTRQNLYSLTPSRPPPLINPNLRFELKERVDWQGEVIVKVDPDEAEALIDSFVKEGVASVAICFLYSYLNSENERIVGEIARRRGLNVSLSCDISPEPREFERTSTTVANAFVSPVVSRYLSALEHRLSRVEEGRMEAVQVGQSFPKSNSNLKIMQSNGGTLSVREASTHAIKTAMSGPAGGIVAAVLMGKETGFTNLITFDMGGTSTDVALIFEGACSVASGGLLSGLPIRTPMLDIHTVGAGGGSIARLDLAGSLRVGPESAGASPGPAAYGIGERITVTDANLLLRRIPSEALLAGSLPLDYSRARAFALPLSARIGRTVEDLALGIVAVAEAAMARAIRHISVERGRSPADFNLLSFGGAGGLHACNLAESLCIRKVLIPPYPGAFSALGLALAPVKREAVKSFPTLAVPSDPESLAELFRTRLSIFNYELKAEISRSLAQEGLNQEANELEMSLDLRYSGQSFELRVPFSIDDPSAILTSFHAMHRERYGYSNAMEPVEAVSMRCTGVIRRTLPILKLLLAETAGDPIGDTLIFLKGGWRPAKIYQRKSLCAGQTVEGASIILQTDTTIYLPEGWRATTDETGSLICEN